MATCSAALEGPQRRKDHLGRWVKTLSDRFVWVARMVIQRIQLLVASTLRERPHAATFVGEPVSLSEIEEYLQVRSVPEDIINRQLLRLDKVAFKGREQSRPQVDVLSTDEEIC